MANVFILTKSSRYLPERVMRKIGYCAIDHEFLWIGGNRIGKYQIDQYRGAKSRKRAFVKSLQKTLKHSHERGHGVRAFSILPGKETDPPGENELMVHSELRPPSSLPKKHYKTKLRTKLDMRKSSLFGSLKKTKNGLYLPLLLNTMKGDHPTKKFGFVYLLVEKSQITLLSGQKRFSHSCTLWLRRLLKLYALT